MTLNDRLAAYFTAHPNQWIDGMELARIAGSYAWRSRCADLRKRGMVIENRQRTLPNGTKRSDYRFVPADPVETPPAQGHNENAWGLRP